ncbi:MAG: dioxygenase [Deltaproteobacteria bacterium]|nr:dioxygenase [Deltaproteobacteria bacterium]
MISRRTFLGASLAAPLATLARDARAEAPPASAPAPAIFVSHGVPLFLPGNEARIAELAAWGKTLPRPRGIVVMTPHFASRAQEIGRRAPGAALFNLPRPMRSQLSEALDYKTPDASALAERVESALGVKPARPERNGFDHTTWMPLRCLFPSADVPVIELGYPFPTPREAFELGRRLAPLRDDGVMFVASGGMTHNLAAGRPASPRPDAPPARYVTEFDAWAAERLAKLAVDDLVDFRQKAPAVELAHPDDGAHYRVILVALGVALHARTSARTVRFPVTGIDATQSKRCVELS